MAFKTILIGSNEPIAFDRRLVESRLRAPFTVDYYRRGGLDIRAVLSEYLDGGVVMYGPDYDRSGLHDVNTDLFPRDEFQSPDELLVRRVR